MAPDALRGWGTHAETGIEPYHAYIGRNKLPVTLNLKSEAGKQAFLDLIKSADVLIENHAPWGHGSSWSGPRLTP